MAIGDALAFAIAGAGSHQPSSGVEEQICGFVKDTDQAILRAASASYSVDLFDATQQTNVAYDSSAMSRNVPFNMSLMITNALYVSKTTSDRVIFSGGQTNS